MTKIPLLSLAAVLAGTMMLHADDWPTYQHDNQRTGVTPEKLGTPLSLTWTFKSPSPPAKGWAMPVAGYGSRKSKPNVSYDDAYRVIVIGNRAYFCSSGEHKVYAVDAASGRIAWTFFTDAAPRLAPSYHEGRLYIGADDGVAYCLDATDGTLVWKHNAAPANELMLGQGSFCSLWPIRAGVMIEEGIAYFTAGLFPSEGIFMFALDATTGRTRWRNQLDQGGFGAPSPQGYMLATRDSIWTTSRNRPDRWLKDSGASVGFNTPIPFVKDAAYRYHNGGSYAQVWNGKHIVYGKAAVLGFDPDAEFIDKYKRKLKGDRIFNWFNTRQIVFKDGIAYGANDFHVMALDEDLLQGMSTNEFSEFEELYKKHGVAANTLLDEKYAEMARQYGEDHPWCVSVRNRQFRYRKERWDAWPAEAEKFFPRLESRCKWMTPLKATEAMIMAGNTLFLGGEDRVHAIDATNGKLLWSGETGHRVRSLSAANGALYVSTIDGNIRCYRSDHKDQSVEIRPDTGRSPYKDERTSFYAATATEFLRDAPTEGYCLVLGGDDGQFAYQLAKQSKLEIEVLERDAARIAEARKMLSSAGLYGNRITIRQSDLKSLPYAPYLFNLVIDQSTFFGDPSPTPVAEVFRVTRPYGGVACVGQPRGGATFGKAFDSRSTMRSAEALAPQNGTAKQVDSLTVIARGPIPDAKNWTHNYATAANTYCSEDKLVKGPFGILWYGEPGPEKRIDRHASPPIPLVVNGVFYTIGYDLVMAYDAFNGVKRWEKTIFGATRTGLGRGPGNTVADDSSLFVVVEDKKCLRLDNRTGGIQKEYPVPEIEGVPHNYWGWIAKQDNILLGTRAESDERGIRPDMTRAEAVFALNAVSGELMWMYSGKGIDHAGVAVAGGKVFFTNRDLTEAEKEAATKNTVRDDSVENRIDLKGKEIEPDLRKIVVLDVKTGTKIWEQPFNATDITLDDMIVSKGAVGVACMVKDGVLVVHGTGSLGHPHREWLQGEYKRRALYAYDAGTGRYLWGGRKNYRKRPIIVGDFVYAEPHAWNLKTGQPKTVSNPLSGQEQVLDFHRGYIGCGHLLASGSALFGSQGGIAYCNLDERTGFTPFANMSVACGLCMAPANGILVAPEGRSQCTCPTPILTSIVLYPRDERRAWSRGMAGGVSDVHNFPVRHACVNLGAKGYREDESRNLWIPYSGTHAMQPGLVGDWLPSYRHDDSQFYQVSANSKPIDGTDMPWIYTSGYADTKPLTFQMVEKGQAPATYTVRLYFAEPEGLSAGERVFSVELQGAAVLSDFDVAAAAGADRKAVVKEFKGITVDGELNIALVPSKADGARPPILCGFEATREEPRAE